MSSHIHELWRELDLPEEYPELDEKAVLARVNAALDGGARPKEAHMKRKLRLTVLLAAALVLLTGTVAAAYRTGVLSLFFRGDTSQLEPYVQSALDTAENQDYRLRVDSSLYDGQNVYAVVTVEALNDQAAQDLMSNYVIAQAHRETWGDEMAESLMKSGSAGPDTFRSNLSSFRPSGGSGILTLAGSAGGRELPNPTDRSRSWQIDVHFGSYLGPQETPLKFWLGFMGEDCAVELPLDHVAQPIRLTPNEEVVCNPYTGDRGVLREFILTPVSFSIDAELLEDPGASYHASFADMAEDVFFLRMKDGSVLTRTQLGGVNGQFETAVDLSQVASIIYGRTEFPVDGSPSFPADLPETLYPFACTEFVPEGYGDFYFPVEELCVKLGADYQWDEDAQTATAAYRGVTLTMTVGESGYRANGQWVELRYETSSDPSDPDYQALPQFITWEDGVLTAPVRLLESWSVDYPYLRDDDGAPIGQMLVIP